MYLTSILSFWVIVAGVAASPFKLPMRHPSPNSTAAQIDYHGELAGGRLPNGPVPTSLKKAGITALQLIALNEQFEVAYFTELVSNVTNSVLGYDIAPPDRAYVIESLTAILEQEKIHVAGANAFLKSSHQAPIGPCKYTFPVTSFIQAITLAQTFTDVVLSTLPRAQAAFAADAGDETPLVPLLGSIIGQEGEQNGFFRSVQRKKPSAAPFLTGGSLSFAFTALQLFIVPGSCDVPLKTINLTTFGKLNVLNKPKPKNMKLDFSVAGQVDREHNSIVYLSGQNLPVTKPISRPVFVKGVAHFTAEFPFEDGFADGLTIAAVVKGTHNFTTNDAVAAASVYGPGLIEVN